jgi:hypothetical protein
LAVSVTSGASKSPTQQQSDWNQKFFGSKQNKGEIESLTVQLACFILSSFPAYRRRRQKLGCFGA